MDPGNIKRSTSKGIKTKKIASGITFVKEANYYTQTGYMGTIHAKVVNATPTVVANKVG